MFFSVRTGPFITRLQTSIAPVVEGLELFYRDCLLECTPEFHDFHIRLEASGNLRRWFRPQALFLFDSKAPFNPLPYNQAFPLFEWGLNWSISQHAHQYLIIHAAVIARRDRAVMLPGVPGAGKSTLCAALINSGWKLLSDELALVSLESGLLAPLGRPVCLKNGSIEAVRAFAPEAVFGNVFHNTAKGSVTHMKPPAQGIPEPNQMFRPAWVVFPRYVAGAQSCLTTKSKGYAFMEIAKNAFNYSLLAATGFRATMNLMEQCDCFEFSYSQLDEAVEAFEVLSEFPPDSVA